MAAMQDRDDPGGPWDDDDGSEDRGGPPGRMQRLSWLWVPLATLAVIVVVLDAATDFLGNIGISARYLWRTEAVPAEPPVDLPGDRAALEAGILARLNDPGVLRGVDARPGEAAYRFEGCTLVLEARFPQTRCGGAQDGALVTGYEERLDLTRFVLDAAYTDTDGPLAQHPIGAGLRAPVVLRMVPSSLNAAAQEYERFTLESPEEFQARASEADRLAFAKRMADAIDAGEIGPLAVGTRREYRFCDGSRMVEPFRRGVATLHALPAERERLGWLLDALGARHCPERGWIFGQ